MRSLVRCEVKTALVLCSLLAGCVTTNSSALTRLNLGMTKQEVLSALGPPDSVAAQGDTEYLRYEFYPPPPYYSPARKEPYFVRLKSGRVESYGKVGDFDSTKDPSINVKVTQ